LVVHWVLRDFAKADRSWLDPLLDAIARACGRLVRDDQSRFLTDVSKLLAAQEAEPEKPEPASPQPPRTNPRRHPEGERAAKRENALSANIKKWLAARRSDS